MFEIGKEYPFSEIEEFQKQFWNYTIEYGEEIIGKQAYHIFSHNRDYWFILNSATNKEYYYKCVYIN